MFRRLNADRTESTVEACERWLHSTCYPGLRRHPVALTGDDAGAIVMSVDPKGPVAAASVHQGDAIALSGEPIRHVESLLHWGQIACGIWTTEDTRPELPPNSGTHAHKALAIAA